MSDPDPPPAPDALVDCLKEGASEEAMARLDRLGEVDAETRKDALRAVRSMAEERPSAVEGVAAQLAVFLADEDRAVRLTTAKLFVVVADTAAEAVVPVVDGLGARLADEAEFYYVRARCAEALGYVALEYPEAVSDPTTLADLRVGLSFDEPEVREKLAKALACVALGDPGRLRHQVDSLAEHLDDDRELVRYHLCTALVVVGCERPVKLSAAADTLRAHLDDENPYVRGRAVEALGLLAGSDEAVDATAALADVAVDSEDASSFLADRVRFARQALDDGTVDAQEAVGTVDSVCAGTDDIVAKIREADADGECASCGLPFPDGGPPVCLRCGRPREP
jgi:HEAT repeat protein